MSLGRPVRTEYQSDFLKAVSQRSLHCSILAPVVWSSQLLRLSQFLSHPMQNTWLLSEGSNLASNHTFFGFHFNAFPFFG